MQKKIQERKIQQKGVGVGGEWRRKTKSRMKEMRKYNVQSAQIQTDKKKYVASMSTVFPLSLHLCSVCA